MSLTVFSAGSAIPAMADSAVDFSGKVIEEPIKIEMAGTAICPHVFKKQFNVFPVKKWEGVPYNGLPVVIQLNDAAEFYNVDGSSLTLLQFMYRLEGGKTVKVKGIYEPVTSIGGIVIQMVHATEAKIRC